MGTREAFRLPFRIAVATLAICLPFFGAGATFARAQSIQCISVFDLSQSGTTPLGSLSRLQSGEPIPAKALERLDSRIIGRAIVQNIHERYEYSRQASEHPGEVAFDWARDSKVQMVFNPSLLAPILENGFLNQHQTGSSKGSYSPEYRARLEDLLADQQIGSYSARRDLRAHAVRPKYGMVDLMPDRFLGRRNSLGEWYGDWVAVFKDEIKSRTTWTINDGLLFGESTFRDPQERAVVQGTFQAKTIDTSVRGGYIEAQIWGEVRMEDVDYVMVPPGAAISQVAKLKRLGLHVFEYEVRDVAGRTRRVVTREL